MNNNIDYRKLKKYRKILDITLDQIHIDTGISISVLNRLERGFLETIINKEKRDALDSYIKKLEKEAKAEFLKEIEI